VKEDGGARNLPRRALPLFGLVQYVKIRDHHSSIGCVQSVIAIIHWLRADEEKRLVALSRYYRVFSQPLDSWYNTTVITSDLNHLGTSNGYSASWERSIGLDALTDASHQRRISTVNRWSTNWILHRTNKNDPAAQS